MTNIAQLPQDFYQQLVAELTEREGGASDLRRKLPANDADARAAGPARRSNLAILGIGAIGAIGAALVVNRGRGRGLRSSD